MEHIIGTHEEMVVEWEVSKNVLFGKTFTSAVDCDLVGKWKICVFVSRPLRSVRTTLSSVLSWTKNISLPLIGAED